MEKTFLGTLEVHTHGYLPQVGDTAPDFELVATDLSPDFVNAYPKIGHQIAERCVYDDSLA